MGVQSIQLATKGNYVQMKRLVVTLSVGSPLSDVLPTEVSFDYRPPGYAKPLKSAVWVGA